MKGTELSIIPWARHRSGERDWICFLLPPGPMMDGCPRTVEPQSELFTNGRERRQGGQSCLLGFWGRTGLGEVDQEQVEDVNMGRGHGRGPLLLGAKPRC